ncbi:G2/mitotic-specific cyclin B, copy E-like protein [Daphnia magna]|uniref:G2/mitotic-specific cyclin B, copy E-like protein n=1 Tax=Daphnia magna TaxID=35525 RepID=A0A165AJ71_9CRUS|nr:G2/mitotic-specific cyclin B, copy E-like protein [Daphnia magna]
MNQTAEECRDPLPPSSTGHRLSLTDLFCTEPFPPPSPTSVSAAVAAAAAAASGLERFRLAQSPRGLFISPTNPFYADLLPDESYLLAQPYLHDQFQWKHSLQPKYRVNDYLSCHPNVTSAMRSELISWLGKVNRQFGYDIETFLLAINFVDRFLAVTVVSADRLQLLGLAAILVAAKKEEVSPPEMKELVGLSGHSYPAQLIRDMEICLLKKLDFHLCPPTASYFFEYYMTFTREHNTDIRGVREVFHQLLENSLVHYELIHYPPSTVAAAALCLAQRFLPTLLPVEPIYWLVELYSGSTELADIQRCFVDMSLWHHTWRQQSICWARIASAAAAAAVQTSSVASSTPFPSLIGDLFSPIPGDPFGNVDFCKQFANFSIAPH